MCKFPTESREGRQPGPVIKHIAIHMNVYNSTGDYQKESHKLVLPSLEVANTYFLEMLQIVGTSHEMERYVWCNW